MQGIENFLYKYLAMKEVEERATTNLQVKVIIRDLNAFYQATKLMYYLLIIIPLLLCIHNDLL